MGSYRPFMRPPDGQWINILATFVVLFTHTICGGTVDPPKAAAVVQGDRTAIHPSTGVHVVPTDSGNPPTPIVAPPPPHLYNNKVSGDQGTKPVNDVSSESQGANVPPHVALHADTQPHVVALHADTQPHVVAPPHVNPTPHVVAHSHADPAPPHVNPTSHVVAPPQFDPRPHVVAPPHVGPAPPHVNPTSHIVAPPQFDPRPHVVAPPHVGPASNTDTHQPLSNAVPPTNSQVHGKPQVESATHPKATPNQGGPQFKGDSVSFSSSSADGPGKRQCSFTVSDPNTFHASTDSFGYPKFMVEGAADNNPLAKQIFQKYRDQKNSGGRGFVIPSEASRHQSIPGFGGRQIQGFPGEESAGANDLDINAMFNKIGRHAGNEGLGAFQHAQPSFPDPDKSIIPGRNFGPSSQLRSSFHRADPFGFPGLNFRKKRQAIPSNLNLGQGFKNQLHPVCPSKSDYIRSFKKYNSVCYLYEPVLQGRKVATCTQTKCGNCGESGRCVAEQESALVWAYCQNGPNARKLELEYIEYPAYCVCKTIKC